MIKNIDLIGSPKYKLGNTVSLIYPQTYYLRGVVKSIVRGKIDYWYDMEFLNTNGGHDMVRVAEYDIVKVTNA